MRADVDARYRASMGIFTGTDIGKAAQDAASRGDTVFVPVLMVGAKATGATSDSELGADVAAIEAAGWTLAHWSVSPAPNNRVIAVPVFRR